MIHHLYQYSGLFHNSKFGFLLQSLGYLSVGMFFFYTGYGLMSSSQKEYYVNTFVKKRIIPLYTFYAFLVLLYALFRILIGNTFTIAEFVQSFIFGKTIVPLAWYLQVTVVVYFVFYHVMRLLKKDKSRIYGILIAILLYCIICFLCELPTTWYESVFCVVLGMVWANKKRCIDDALDNKGFVITVGSFVLFVGCLVLSKKLGVIPKMFSTVFFVVFITAFSFLVSNTRLINNKLTKWLGKYSFEIYMSQGFFLLLRRGGNIEIKNVYLFIIITIVGTFIAAVFMKPLYEIITKKCRGVLDVK